MVRSLPEGILLKLIAQAQKNASEELAWRYPAVLEVGAALAACGFAILGGGVMHADKGGKLDYYRGEMNCGNWFLDRQPEDSWADYVAASVNRTQRYIKAYVRRNGDTFWFVLTFADEQEFARLSRPGT